MSIKKRMRTALTLASLTGLLGACAPAPAKNPVTLPAAPEGFLDPYVAHKDEQSGLPTFVWLSQRTEGTVGADATTVAWRVLHELEPSYQMSAAAMKTVLPKKVHDLGHGSILVQFGQQVDGLEVFLRGVTVALDQHLRPVAASGNFAPLVRRTAADFPRPASDAVAAALQHVIGGSLPVGQVTAAAQKGSYTQFTVAKVTLGNQSYTLAEPARTKQVLFPSAQGLIPAYYVELGVRASDAAVTWKSFVISSVDRAVLFTNDLTAYDAYSYRVWADTSGKFLPNSGPYGDSFLPHPTGKPDGSRPTTKLAPNLVTLQNVPFSKNDPWLPPGATEAKGNNVWAYADIVSEDGFNTGDVALIPSAAGVFDYTLDPEGDITASEDTQRAGIDQLFYTVNYMHDVFYDAGWDEKSGNPQLSNYGRGGVEGDAINAEAQDFSGINNANCSTPADGKSPRIQMYQWSNPSVLTALAPADLASSYAITTAAFGPLSFNLTADLVLVDDGADTTSDGCTMPFVNAAAVAGKIAVIDRGNCDFVTKTKNAQLAGALGVIVANSATGSFTSLGGTDATITIPAVMLGYNDSNQFKTKLAAGTTVQATIVRTSILRPGAFDNSIIAHEWGHALSNRLIGDASGISTQQSRGLGEGWSDIVALVTLVRPEAAMAPANTNWNGTFAVSQFAQHLFLNNYYYGIRRYPYSADMTKNPLTYKYITDDVALPTTPVPNFGSTGATNSEVHSFGEVWASMLWDCYTNMLRDTSRYTYEQAQKTMREYLVASMKLTPMAPTLLEARDALLATMYAHDAKDFAQCADSFARRKAGIGAVAPDRNSTTNAGAVESDKLGPDLTLVSYKLDDSARSCDNDGVIDNTETGRLALVVRNTGTAPLTGATVTVTGDSQYFYFQSGGRATVPTLAPYQSATVNVDFQVKDAPAAFSPTLHISATAPSLVVPRNVTQDIVRRMNYDVAEAASTTDTFAVASKLGWSTSGDTTIATKPIPWKQVPDEKGAGVWFIPNNGVRGDQYLVSPPIVVDAAANFGFTLKHRFSYETDAKYNYDGSIVEISADNGTTWTDIGSMFTSGGYTGDLSIVPDAKPDTQNPLLDPVTPMPRPAFVKSSPGYPDLSDSVADLGTTYAGKTVRLRFRVGTDPATGVFGWEISQISVTGATNKPFPHEGAQPAVCMNRPPVVTVTPGEQTVPGGGTATLQGTVMDADNDSLVYEWVQLSGPTVPLLDPTALNQAFTIPPVTENVEASFVLRASDGKAQAEAVGKVTFAIAASGGGGGGGEADGSGGCGCRTVPSKTRAADALMDFLLVMIAGLYCNRRRVVR